MSRREIDDDFCPVEKWPARSLFLHAVRVRYPYFWTSLNELWRKGDVTVRDEVSAAPLDDWLWQVQAVDDWLIDVVKATIRLWENNPDGGNAMLDPQYAWFTMPDPSMGKTWEELTRFTPALDSPYPLWSGPDPVKVKRLIDELNTEASASFFGEMDRLGWIEPLAAYEKRMEDQFRSQLKAHSKMLRRSVYGEADNKTAFEHAQWTALAFAGISYADIARSDLANAPHLDPESTVRKAVTRFAEKISLTLLPKRREGM